MPWWVVEESQPVNPAQALAAFYDRRAPAALAYCSRMCQPESIADAVEEAFGKVFANASMSSRRLGEDELDDILRDSVRAAAADRASRTRSRRAAARRVEEAERAYDALRGDDAPALGRSLLGEMIEAEQFAWPESAQVAPAKPPVEPGVKPARGAEPVAAASPRAPGAAHGFPTSRRGGAGGSRSSWP